MKILPSTLAYSQCFNRLSNGNSCVLINQYITQLWHDGMFFFENVVTFFGVLRLI